MAAPSFHKQRNHYDPDNGLHGDCYRTCLAILLGLLPEEVPNFNDGTADAEQADRSASAWLARRGLGLVTYTVPGTIEDLPGIMREVACRNTGAHYVLSGRSRTGVNHVVIARNDEIVWDPSLTEAGIVGPMSGDPELGFMFEFLGFAGGIAADPTGYRIAGLVEELHGKLDLLHRQADGILDAVRPQRGIPERREAA